MLNRDEYNQVMDLPEEKQNHAMESKSQAFGPGQLNTYSRFIDDENDSFIVYSMNALQPKKYKLILSDKCLSVLRLEICPSSLWLMNGMVAYSEVYLWEGSHQSFSTLSPITNAKAFWERSSSIVAESEKKIKQSLVQQGYALEDFIIIDSEKLLQSIEKVIKIKMISVHPDFYDSIFKFSAPFDLEKMSLIIQSFQMTDSASERSLIIEKPNEESIFFIKKNPHVVNIEFIINESSEVKLIIENLKGLKNVTLRVTDEFNSALFIPDNFCELLKISNPLSRKLNKLKIFNVPSKQSACMKKLDVSSSYGLSTADAKIEINSKSITDLRLQKLEAVDKGVVLTEITSLECYHGANINLLKNIFPNLKKFEGFLENLEESNQHQGVREYRTYPFFLKDKADIFFKFPNLAKLVVSYGDLKCESKDIDLLDELAVPEITIKNAKFENPDILTKKFKKIQFQDCEFTKINKGILDVTGITCDVFRCPPGLTQLVLSKAEIEKLIFSDPTALKVIKFENVMIDTLDLRQCTNLLEVKIDVSDIVLSNEIKLFLPEGNKVELIDIAGSGVLVENPGAMKNYKKLREINSLTLLASLLQVPEALKYLSALTLVGKIDLINNIIRLIPMPQLSQLILGCSSDKNTHLDFFTIPDSVLDLKIQLVNVHEFNIQKIKSIKTILIYSRTECEINMKHMQNIDTLSIKNVSQITFDQCKIKNLIIIAEVSAIIFLTDSSIEHLQLEPHYNNHNILKHEVILEGDSQIKKIYMAEYVKLDIKISPFNKGQIRIGSVYCGRAADILMPAELEKTIAIHPDKNLIVKSQAQFENQEPIQNDFLEKKAWSFSLDSHAVPDVDTKNPEQFITQGKGHIEIYSHPRVAPNYYRLQVAATCQYDQKSEKIKFNFEPDEKQLERVPIQVLPLEKNTAAQLRKNVDQNPAYALTYMSYAFSNQSWVPLASESALPNPYHAVIIYTSHPDYFLKDGYWSESQSQLFLRCRNPNGKQLNQNEKIELFFLYKKGKRKAPTLPELNSELKKYLYDTLKSKSKENKYARLRFLFDDKIKGQEKLEKLVQYCQFDNKALDLNLIQSIFISPIDMIIEQILQRKGVCRHRAQCFFLLARMLNLPVLMRDSHIHSLAEIESEDGILKMQDLGGADPRISKDLTKKGSVFELKNVELDLLTASKIQASTIAPTSTASSGALMSTSTQGIFTQNNIAYLKYKKIFSDLLKPAMITDFDALKEKALKKPAPLVLLDTLDDLTKMVEYLTNKASGSEKIIYIHTPKDLKRFFSTYQIKNGKRIKQEGSLSYLIKSGGLLLINWSNFTVNQLAAYQSLIDKNGANLWGNPINYGCVRIIGLGLKQNVFHQCASFLSRCQKIQLSFDFLNQIKQSVEPHLESTAISISIHLFSLPDWKEALFGKVIMDGKQYQYQEGQLQKAIKLKATEIIISDPPQDPEFNEFVYHINHGTGKWVINDEEKSIPKIKIQTQQKDLICDSVKVHLDLARLGEREAVFLSLQEWHLLFTQQIFSHEGGKTSKGWLDSYQSDKYYFLIHGHIPKSLWEKMLSEIKENHKNKDFHFYLSPGSEIENYYTAISKSKVLQSKMIPPEKFRDSEEIMVVSNDPDFYEKVFLIHHPDFNVVHIAPLTDASDIIFKSTITTQANDDLKFEAIYSQVFLKLQKGENIVLQGAMSPSLYQALFPLIENQKKLYVNGKWEEVKGLLRIILPVQSVNQLALQNFSQEDFIPEQYIAYFQKSDLPLVDAVIAFYKIANRMPLDGMGRPPHLNLNYQRLHHSVKAIQRQLHFHNPLKSVLHYDFPKKSDEYAYLSVLSKWMFAQNDASEVNLKRLASLLKSKDETEIETHFNAHPWVWLNCFRGRDLRKILGNEWGKIIEQSSGIPSLTDELQQNVMRKIKKYQSASIPLSESTSSKQSLSKQKRLKNRLVKLLNDSDVPLIFLKGDPGVGKTYTMRHLQKKYQFHKYEMSQSEQLLAWLNDDGKGEIPLLSIDEANFMLPGMLDFLKGIKHGKIYYQNKWHPITNRHKVMLTGNPEYFPGRHYHDFIREEAVTLYVNQPEEKFLRKLLNFNLKKIFSNLPDQLEFSVESLVNIYQSVQRYNPVYVYSIRDLESVTARFIERIKNGEEVKSALFMAAKYEFSGNFINEKPKKIFMTFLEGLCDSEDNAVISKIIELNAEKKIAFPCELETVIQSIEEDLTLDEHAMKMKEAVPIKRGVMLEGDVGIGKTTLLKTVLENHGFVYENASVKSKEEWQAFMDKKIEDADTSPLRKYIEINVVEPENKGTGISSTSEFREILIQAFHEGKAIIINELNLDASLEILLNQLLNGYDPLGNAPKIKGFRAYVSQNPSSDEGRRPQSLAIKNRLHVHYIQPFSKTGLENLAQYHGVPDHQDFVRAYKDSKATMRAYFNAMDQLASPMASNSMNLGI